ncbi:hypothetical protein [Rhizobium mesoamericanum]|uniref:hypothetical protein n=1 Tax=Rhizobium mesoamericanum TaxID=1079800 RepID=UPI000417551D|nr:hypothetical protein [Rhizobium mesoamericanum]
MLKLLAASLLAVSLAGSAFAQSNPAPTGSTMNKNNGAATDTMKKPKKIDKMTTSSTTHKTHNLNKENCKKLTGKRSLQTQGGNSNTENTENTCADNNN